MGKREKGVVRTSVDGQSPLTTYYLNEMGKEAIERYGLTKYLRKEVKSDEQRS